MPDPKSPLRSSLSTEVITTCRNFIFFTAKAVLYGSMVSIFKGLPVLTEQNPHALVQISPKIIIVAVPRPQHSNMFGHLASSQTV